MLSDGDRRDLLEQVVSEVAGDAAQVEWLTPGRSWSAHVRLRGATGLVGYLLTSPEWQEARFEEPHYSTFLITVSDDADDVQTALRRLARSVVTYVSGAGRFERSKGLHGSRTTLILDTEDGVWRVGKRSTTPPRFTE